MKKLFLLAITILTFSNAYSNWTVVGTTGTVINSISVVDQNIIWAVGDANRVYKSTNGGATWLLRNTGLPAGNLYGVSALDTTTCWVGTVAGSIYKTTNGGVSWTLQFSQAGSFSNGVKMFNANYGIYYGDPSGNGVPYQLRFTSNGGTNWLLSPGAPIATNEFGVINAWDWTDSDHVWVGSANIVSLATTAKVYKTTNGYGDGPWSFGTLTGTGTTDGLYYQAVGFTDNNNGMAGANNSSIRKTIDGGVTWTNVANPPGIPTYATFNMNGLKDGSNTIRASLVRADSGFVLRTTTLGNSWIKEPLPSPVDLDGLQHLQFINGALGFAASASTNGAILRYMNTTGYITMAIEGLYDAAANALRKRDTVRVYLRNSASPYAIVDSALSVIDSLTFRGDFKFNNAAAGNYFIHLKYRSGLETWSAAPVAFSPGTVTSYDFTPAASQAFGNNQFLVDAAPVRFAIYSGDVDQNGVINLQDILLISNNSTNFINGYVVTDVNGDNVTNLNDILIAFNNSNKFIVKIIPT